MSKYRFARTCDGLLEGRPNFGERQRLEAGAERDAILAYLRSARIIRRTTARTEDVVDPSNGKIVPRSYRTDGSWFWTDAVAYYLEIHGIAPEDDLLGHIRRISYQLPPLDEADLSALSHVYDRFMEAGRTD